MSYYETFSKTSTYRKGTVVTCSVHDLDGRRFVRTGGRRTRQIAKRHWVRQESNSWCSNGGGTNVATTMHPGRDEQFVEKPRNFGGTSVWLKRADGGHRTG